MTDRNEVIALCQKLNEAHKERDADAIVACYAPDALIYGLAPPLASRGMDRSETAEWLATWDGPVTIETQGANLVLHENVAWSAELTCLRGTRVDGQGIEVWFRTTRCFQNVSGHWLIVHEHSSTPFYMDGSFRAAIDLTPESRTAWNASPETPSR